MKITIELDDKYLMNVANAFGSNTLDEQTLIDCAKFAIKEKVRIYEENKLTIQLEARRKEVAEMALFVEQVNLPV